MASEWIICPQCKGEKRIKLKKDNKEHKCDWCNGEGHLCVRVSKEVHIATMKRL